MRALHAAVLLLCLAPGSAPAAQEARGPAASRGAEQPPGIRIERAPPGAEERAAHARLAEWRAVYDDRLAAVRRSVEVLFAELERSSLATLTDRCRSLLARVREVDRSGLFPAPDVELDRMLFGSLERFRAGAASCLARRFVAAYGLLVEARAGLDWLDRRVARRLGRRMPLRGLGPPG